MAKGFDRLHIKSAVKSRNKMSLDQTHLTTMDFGQIVPLYAKELIPGDKFHINANFFSRMAPLVRPTYGKFSFKTVSIFCPLHQVAYDVEAWLAGATTWEGITPNSRFIQWDHLTTFIINHCSTTTGATSANCDFSFVNANSTTEYRVYTQYGKYAMKVLNSLGYSMPQHIDWTTVSDWSIQKVQYISALPLLCFAKAYNDYMSQSQRFNTSALTDLLRVIKYNSYSSADYNANTHSITFTGLKTIFDNIKLCYENDYFTSAWQNPNSALYTNESLHQYEDIPNIGPNNYVTNTNAQNYLQHNISSNLVSNIAQRQLNWLKGFDDWVRRNNYSGSRKVQNIYSRFGIKTDDYRSHYAQVLDTKVFPVQVGDVTATADTNNISLGDFAGKGIMNGSHPVNYDSNDYGYLFVFGYFTVIPMYSYGCDRSVLRVQPFDYYNPEFDGIGAVDAISYREVYSDPRNSESSDQTSDGDVFGFTEKYNSYRFGRDIISGEFRSTDPNSDMNIWHTGRILNKVRAANEMVAQSSSMNTLPQYDSEYDRIFAQPYVGFDHFYMTCNFNVEAFRPMLSLNQVPNLGEGDTNVPRNGNEIN